MSQMPSTLRLSMIPYYPMVNPECKVPTFHSSRWCQRPGLAVEIVKLIADYLNLTIETQVFDYNSYDSHYSTINDDLNANDTDLFTLLFERTSFRENVNKMVFSDPLYESQTRIAVKRNDHSLKSIFDFFTVYGGQSWIFMVLAFVLFTGFGVFVRYLEWRLNLRDAWNPSSLVYKMVRLQLIQPDPIDYKFMAGSMSLIVFTLFQICVIVGIYESWILSSVIRSKDPLPFRPEDLIQVLTDKKYFIVSPTKNYWVMNEIETSSASPYYELRQALKDNPVFSLETVDGSLEVAMEQNAIIIMPSDQLMSFAAEKYCDLVYMDSPIPPNQERFMFRFGSPFIKPFNEAIQKNAVLIQKLYRKYIISRAPSECSIIDTRPLPLKLTPYYGVLILFLIGMSFACFMFSGEIWQHYYKHQH